jgi:enamine deaminase RidA (YjgF/YER057c/UK114 family)
MKKEHLPTGEAQKGRAYSPAVITEGGRIVWLAGQTALTDADGKDLSGNFEAQAERIVDLLGATIARAGGTLADMVTMTVFINDPRNGDRFVALRGKRFPDGKYPASALITVSHFARPGLLIEIQGVAVVAE